MSRRVAAGLLLGAWTAGWVVLTWPVSGLSWHFFATGSGALLHTDGLSTYARHPELQVGPVSLLVGGVFELLPAGAAQPAALLAMALLGPLLVGLLAREVAPERRLARVLLAALVAMPAWTVLAVRWGHLDDVLAIAAAVGAVVGLCRRRPLAVGLLLGLAIAAKPWAVGFLPLLLALPRHRVRAAVAGFATAAAAWLPFLVGDPGTTAALHPPVGLVRGSGLHTLGVRGAVVPAWGRTVQLLAAPAAALAVVLSRRWAGVLLVALAVRIALDPQDNAYFVGSAAMAAVVFDLLGTRRLLPWTTVLTVVLLWQPFVRDYPHRLTATTGLTHWWFAHPDAVGWIHLAWAVLAVAVVAFSPPRSRPWQPGTDPDDAARVDPLRHAHRAPSGGPA